MLHIFRHLYPVHCVSYHSELKGNLTQYIPNPDIQPEIFTHELKKKKQTPEGQLCDQVKQRSRRPHTDNLYVAPRAPQLLSKVEVYKEPLNTEGGLFPNATWDPKFN